MYRKKFAGKESGRKKHNGLRKESEGMKESERGTIKGINKATCKFRK